MHLKSGVTATFTDGVLEVDDGEERQPVVWSWAPYDIAVGSIEADGEAFVRRMAAVSEGQCPDCVEAACKHGTALARGIMWYRPIQPVHEPLMEWAGCGCGVLWAITYERRAEIEQRYLHAGPLLCHGKRVL